MDARDIEYYLSLLGKQLEVLELRKSIHLLMIDGGFMLTQVGNRTFTKDVDVMVQNIDHPQYSDEYRIFKNAARYVAYDTGIAESWLSDNIGDFLTMAGSVPKGKLWRKFGRRLRVYVPPKDYILAHKLIAGREKDWSDIEALRDELGITTRNQMQKVVDKYIMNKDIQQNSSLYEMFDKFFLA